MAAYYPLREHPELREIAGGILVLLIGTAIAIGWGRRRPYLGFGWFLFVGTLVPVIGLVQVGLQSMADRYTYIPYIGLFVAVVWFVRDIAVRVGETVKTVQEASGEPGTQLKLGVNENGPGVGGPSDPGSSISHLPSSIF